MRYALNLRAALQVWVARDPRLGDVGFLRTTDFIIDAAVIKKTLGLE